MIIALFRATGAGNRTRLTGFSGHFFELTAQPAGCAVCLYDSPMIEKNQNETGPWRKIVDRLGREFARLEPSETNWLRSRLEDVADCQRQMHEFFLQAGGAELCRRCAGDCCGCGKNHLTLVNLLGYLANDQAIPEPEFWRACPYLGDEGCRHEVGRRPFNCVSFLCERVEERLDPASREAFYRLEGRLRRLYAEFDRRYAGSGLCGIFIRTESLAGRPFLAAPGAC